MKLNIQKWGNSAAVRLPAPMLVQMGAQIGDAFEVDFKKESVVLRVAKPSYKLADLLAQCNKRAKPPKLDGWDDVKPVGGEVW